MNSGLRIALALALVASPALLHAQPAEPPPAKEEPAAPKKEEPAKP